jgi:hypothetical protein
MTTFSLLEAFASHKQGEMATQPLPARPGMGFTATLLGKFLSVWKTP